MTDTAPTDPLVDSTEATEPDGTDDTTGNAEAASYRRRLRTTEGERDGLNERVTSLTGQLTGLQRAEVERLAGAQLSRPGDVWLDNAELNTLVTDDGRVDPERVMAAVRGVLSERPQLARPVSRMQPDHSQGSGGNGPEPVTMADLLKGARKR